MSTPGVASGIELPALVAKIHLDVATSVVPADIESITDAIGHAAPWLSEGESSEVVRRVLGRVGGLGEIEGLLHDDDVTDVLIDGPGEVVVERHGRLTPAGLVLDADGVSTLVEQLARIGNRRVDSRHPMADLSLPGGFRVNIAVAPVAVGGPFVSIRRFRTAVSDLTEVAGRSAGLIAEAVADRRNVLVSGATGAGKTTLLGAMVDRCGSFERLVVSRTSRSCRRVGTSSGSKHNQAMVKAVRRRRSGSCSEAHYGCGRIGWGSARFVALKRSISSTHSVPVTEAAWQRFTPMVQQALCGVWSCCVLLTRPPMRHW